MCVRMFFDTSFPSPGRVENARVLGFRAELPAAKDRTFFLCTGARLEQSHAS